jgi:Ca-activated chloride channel family protein
MMRWLRQHQLSVGYVVTAAGLAVTAVAAAWATPQFSSWLAENQLQLEDPQYLWLTALIPILWFVRLHSLTDIPRGQQIVSTVLRSVMIAVLALALTGISEVTHEPRRAAVVMVVDVSNSVSDETLAEARNTLQSMWDARGQNSLQLVTFAGEPTVVPLQVDESGQLSPIERHPTGGLTTNLQKALQLAQSLYPSGAQKRVFVVTDGNETQGNGLSELASLRRMGVSVHVKKWSEQPLRHELMVRQLDVPEDIEVNVPFDVSVDMLANYEGKARCTLKIDKLVADVQTVTMTGKPQMVDFEPVRVREGGERAFRVDCAPDPGADATDVDPSSGDQVATNNTILVTRDVPEKQRLLYVEGERMYSTTFRNALRDDFQVDVRGAGGVPRTLQGMKRYKAIVISDVPRQTAFYRDNISYSQMRLLHAYTKAGGLLVFTGGQNSLGPGGYSDTYLERAVLPVRLDARHEIHTPRLALVLVIDRSGSMSGRKIELAKKAARETVKVLGRDDRVGIIAFDSQPIRIIRLTRASSTRRFDHQLKRLKAGGGTAIYPALDGAFQMLEGIDAQIKHVILLTDGQSNRTGILHLAEMMARKKITISTIAIGAGSDRNLLANIADVGRGRTYYTESAESIPKLFVDETRKVTRDSLVSDGFRAVLNPRFARLRFLKGVRIRDAPALDGYVSTQAKPGADVILATHRKEPLLARWKRGKGWVYVFTSDIKNKWAHRWIRWRGFAPLWRQLIKSGIHRKKDQWVYPAHVTVARGKLTIAADAVDSSDQFVGGVTSRALVTAPDGTQQTVTLTQTAPGRYESTVDASQYGPYQVNITHKKDGKKVAVSQARVTYPYPEELLRFEPNLERVRSLANATGGMEGPPMPSLFSASGNQSTHREPIWHWLLAAVLGAFLVDVLLRRVRLWHARTLQWGDATSNKG